MSFSTDVVRVARTYEALDALLRAIETGQLERPDRILLQGECRLDRLDSETLGKTIGRLHRCVLRGFRAANLAPTPGNERLALWRAIASRGFHDFGDEFSKEYDSPFVENHDYIGPYLESGLDALDPYRVYGAVLGSHDYGVEDLIGTKLCSGVTTIIEPMAGTAELARQGHFRFPDFRYVMIDLDPNARDYVNALPWLPQTQHHYLTASVLDEDVWQQTQSLTSGPSLSFVGKQSHHLFDARELHRLLELGTEYSDFLVLETPPITLLCDLADEEELTRPEMADAGLNLALLNEPELAPNPFTNRVDFRLDAWDASGRRTLFRYPNWTVWPQPLLVGMADLLGLHAWYFHSELDEFVSVHHDASDSDCHDNVNFMLFTRHRI
jgi:hypothetical protein